MRLNRPALKARRAVFARITAWSAPATLLAGCSNGVVQSTCARTQAIVDDRPVKPGVDDKDILTKAGLPRNTPGGYIDVDTYVDKETGVPLVNFETALAQGKALMKTRRCTALVSFDKEGAADGLRVWTADHCIRPASDVAMRLHLFGAGGYAPFEVRSDLFDFVSKARSESADLRPGAREFFLSAFNTFDTDASRSGAKACKALQPAYADAAGTFASKLALNVTTRGDLPSQYAHACFSMADLSTFRLRLVKPASTFNVSQKKVWDESMAHSKTLRAYYASMQKDGSAAKDFSVRLGEEMFSKAFQELMNVRRQEAFHGFNQAVGQGRCSRAGTGTATVCAARENDRLKSLGTRYFDKKNFYENDLEAKLGQLAQAKADPMRALADLGPGVFADLGLMAMTGKAEGREKFRAASDLVWKAIDLGAKAAALADRSTAQSGKPDSKAARLHDRFQYTFQTNVHPAGKPENVRWRWMSSYRSRADDRAPQDDGHKIILSLHDNEDPFARVLMLSSHRTASPYHFEKGDSGTAVGVFILPFGVLSTVDWEETEGLPITTLPTAGSSADEPASVAGSGKTGEPGRTDASNGNGAAAGSEVASGNGRKGGNGRDDCL